MDGELKPILIALIINLIIVYVLPKLFVNPTGFKAFDDFVSYLKAQQAFIGFSSVLLAVVSYGTLYYLKHYDQSSGGGTDDLLTEDFMTPAPRQK
ncbi:hypothetical protein EBT25_10605 [bacterium]|nr:hypothetical protein [bacterium]